MTNTLKLPTRPQPILRLAISVLFAWLGVAATAQAQTFRLTDLGTLPGGGPTQALGMNAAGVVVGSGNLSSGAFHAVRLGKPVHDLGALAGGLSAASAINASGQIIGSAYTSTGSSVYHAVVFDGTRILDLGTLSGFFSSASGINASGLVIGNGDLYGGANAGWTYRIGVSRTLQGLPTLGGLNSAAAAVNDDGIIVGSANLPGPYAAGGASHAASWLNGVVTDLGTLSPSNPDAASMATAISSNGLIAGSSTAPDGTVHAFLLTHGLMGDLGLLAGTNMTAATGVNALGVVIGTANIPRLDYRGRPVPGKGTRAAFVYRNGTMVNLSSLVPAGWMVNHAAAINDAGQIAATATGPGGVQHGVLLSP